MNPYLKHLQKIEFVLTWGCTGACRHCSQGDHPKTGEHLDPDLGIKLIREVSAQYKIQTVMVFGGEPLLYPDATAKLMAAARDVGIPHRQLVTNGYFTKSEEKMRRTVCALAKSEVNDLLLSVDAFHQETIPLETVRAFALLAKEAGIPLRLQPAWLKNADDKNPYNEKTHAILNAFGGFPVGSGNVIFPEGNAKKYLAEYFTDSVPENPYVEDPTDIRTLSIDPEGSLLGESLREKSVMEILENYKP